MADPVYCSGSDAPMRDPSPAHPRPTERSAGRIAVVSHFHVIAGAEGRIVHPEIRTIGMSDIVGALRDGLADFLAKPSHVIFICIMYPLIGVVLAAWTSGGNVLHLLFPLMSGFALLGPFAAIGLYEISRRRELGEDPSWSDALSVLRSPAIPAIVAIGALLMALFLAWMFAAQAIYAAYFGPEAPASIGTLLRDVLTTERGLGLLVTGNAIGLLFAVVVLCATAVAFPILIDRDVGAYEAIRISFMTVLANPVPMLAWGVVVAVGLALGSLPLFAGLVVVFPVLGHATWHLYRRLVTTAGK